ncbi:MAG: peptidoglycan recognition protein family protein [Gemmatimonadaceae bacterium]
MSYRIVTRAEWGARYGKGHATNGAKVRAIVHHDGFDRSRPDMTFEQECALMLFYENFHANGEPGKPGLTATNKRIAYSWVPMQTGRIYEGCGWDRIGAHTGGLNSSAYAWFFPVNGAATAPTPDALAAFRWHLTEGVRLGKLSPQHIVSGHQDHGKPKCPGKLVYDVAVLGIVPASTSPTLPQIIAARPSLRLGKGGENASVAERAAVTHMQHRLIALGFMKPRLDDGRSAATGHFGPLTDAAVRRLQVARGLRRHELGGAAIVGPSTWAVLR